MKKIVLMTLVLAALVLSLASCSDGSGGFSSPFEGTWAPQGDPTYLQVTFTGNKFEWRTTSEGGLTIRGTFEYGSTWISWTRTWISDGDPGGLRSYNQGYDMTGNILNLHSAGAEWSGRFVKIK